MENNSNNPESLGFLRLRVARLWRKFNVLREDVDKLKETVGQLKAGTTAPDTDEHGADGAPGTGVSPAG